MDETQLKIKEFLSRFFKSHDLQPDEDIFSLGFVNSLFALELVMFIEHSFELEIPNQEITLDNFRTIAAMERLIERQAAPVGPTQ